MTGAYWANSKAARSRSAGMSLRHAERPPDVLVVDHPVGEGDAAVEAGRKSPRLDTPTRQVDQLGRCVVGVGRQADRVGSTWSDGSSDEPADQVTPGQFVVAEHVRHDVSDPPSRADAGRLPLLWRQLL